MTRLLPAFSFISSFKCTNNGRLALPAVICVPELLSSFPFGFIYLEVYRVTTMRSYRLISIGVSCLSPSPNQF